MIEFEIKYELSSLPEGIEKLTKFETKKQSDIYYDTKDYELIQNGNFLRIRNNQKLEFKIDINDASHLFCKELSYDKSEIQSKISDLNGILAHLNLPESPVCVDFNQFVDQNKLQVIAPINKKRDGYILNEKCNIFVDDVDDLGLFLEAELIINAENISSVDASKIKKQLINTLIAADILNLDSREVSVGYVELYLLKHHKQIYDLGKFKI